LLSIASLAGFTWVVYAADPPAQAPAPRPQPPVIALDQAVLWALQNNPEIAALRQQHGIAAAAVVIAQTYPFNPIWEAKVRPAVGPASAGITNAVSNEHKVLIDVEIRGQGRYRRQGAAAALTRTDWEIANQELALGIRVIRAYQAVLYRLEKLQLIRRTIALNEEAFRQAEKFAKTGGSVREADLILIRTELANSQAQLALGRSTLSPVWFELRRALGLLEQPFLPTGQLETPSQNWDPDLLSQAALRLRPDFHARHAAVAEAEARLRLAIADRYGNPNLGPAYEYDPTRVNLIGVQFTIPLPVFNTHEGDILQRRAEQTRALLDLRQTEFLVRQDVQAALARVYRARELVDTYQRSVVPGLEKSINRMNLLFRRAEPGVDVLRVIDVTRKYLAGLDVELDARWELAQAQADLAAAVGDPALIVAPADFAAHCTPPAQ
jgi:cobalt-zinc-cadmium efflux system outer membrane protein